MIGVRLNGRYEILEHLGDGSTATVYKARDAILGREVAIKILLPHVREATRKRFFQEATAVAQLNHPNIMAIHDAGQYQDRYYLVVELVDGVPLSDFIPSSPSVVIELGVQIAQALDYAHQRHVIHRDIKPANIKVTPERQIKLMDLGLALPPEAKRVTAPGMVIGTPAYISPEQAQGHPIDHRADIYSLGVVLYEMATGQLPFDADDITALLVQHVRQAPPPPRTLAPTIPAALENVILKCLEKDSGRRYQRGRSLAEALRAILPVSASDVTTLASQPELISTSQPVVRIIVADDHAMLRHTLIRYLETNDDFVVLAEASDGQSALTQTVAIRPDILILDLNMPGRGGLDVLPDIRSAAPEVRVLVLTGRDEEDYIMRALRSGAHGYILKSTDENELLNAIRRVAHGELVLGRGVAEKVPLLLGISDDPNRLTDQERLALLYVAVGYTNEQISAELGCSMSEVVEIIASILNKLDVKDRMAAALRALRKGLIALQDIQNLPLPPS